MSIRVDAFPAHESIWNPKLIANSQWLCWGRATTKDTVCVKGVRSFACRLRKYPSGKITILSLKAL